MGRRLEFIQSRFCIESYFYMEFSRQQRSFESKTLKKTIVGRLGSCLELKFHGQRD
jgi:hypothetical protein